MKKKTRGCTKPVTADGLPFCRILFNFTNNCTSFNVYSYIATAPTCFDTLVSSTGGYFNLCY